MSHKLFALAAHMMCLRMIGGAQLTRLIMCTMQRSLSVIETQLVTGPADWLVISALFQQPILPKHILPREGAVGDGGGF